MTASLEGTASRAGALADGATSWLAWRRLLVVLPRPSRRTLRLVALGYVLKTLAFGVAWYLVPDLPQRVQGSLYAALAGLSAFD